MINSMAEFARFYRGLNAIEGNTAFAAWRDQLPGLLAAALHPERHGRLVEWQALLAKLPDIPVAGVLCDVAVRVYGQQPLPAAERAALAEQLLQFKPWRKGPFDIHGVYIDSEWRSDLKWDRLKDHIAPLQDRLVLDVGCGNGYYAWRMQAAGARAVLGLDPTLLYVVQYCVLRHFMPALPVFVLPLPLEDMPDGLQAYDTVFSMGVLYHRRSPLEHLQLLQRCLRSGGELVLETLVVDGDAETVLAPENRYAHMKNVYAIPSCAALQLWLQNCGFSNIRLLDVTPTTPAEQRVTAWSGTASLQNFLDPADPTRTVEGYPAPQRALLLANVN
jgi:tRNA (mo5U34)-methyltransferase